MAVDDVIGDFYFPKPMTLEETRGLAKYLAEQLPADVHSRNSYWEAHLHPDHKNMSKLDHSLGVVQVKWNIMYGGFSGAVECITSIHDNRPGYIVGLRFEGNIDPKELEEENVVLRKKINDLVQGYTPR